MSKFKFNNDTIQKAIELFKSNRNECDRRYGHIGVWDVSQVTDMEELFADGHFQ